MGLSVSPAPPGGKPGCTFAQHLSRTQVFPMPGTHKGPTAQHPGTGTCQGSASLVPGTHKGPTAQHHHPVPLHVGDPPPGDGPAGVGAGMDTLSWHGWGWMGPCGCQARDHPYISASHIKGDRALSFCSPSIDISNSSTSTSPEISFGNSRLRVWRRLVFFPLRFRIARIIGLE
jgi:hypothetical protein